MSIVVIFCCIMNICNTGFKLCSEEFFSAQTSKAVALAKLGEYYGISQQEIIAIGDQTNDLSMIEYAGLGVAMGNGVNKVKNAADYVTASNIEDGVAKVIEKFVL